MREGTCFKKNILDTVVPMEKNGNLFSILKSLILLQMRPYAFGIYREIVANLVISDKEDG